MRVLYHHRTQGGWVEAVHIRGIVDGLREMGHEVDVVGPSGRDGETERRRDGETETPGARSPAPRLPGSPAPRLPGSRAAARRLPQGAFELLEIAYNLVSYPRLLAIARERRPDVIYERAAAYLCAGALVSRRLGIPLVMEFNDVAGLAGLRRHRLAAVARALEALVLRHASAAIPVTSYLRDELRTRGFDERRIAVIGNGVDPERFHPGIDGLEIRRRYGVGSEECLVGFSGAMSPWYRLPEVVEAFAAAFARAPEVRLLLIGDGPEKEAVRQKIAAVGCGDRIQLGPRVSHDEVPAHLAAFDVALIPHCNQHGSPVKLFEYLGVGKPVVAVRTAGVTDIVTHEREALLADAGDLASIMAHIARLAGDRAAAAALGRRGRDLVLAHHTWKKNAERTEAVLAFACGMVRGAHSTRFPVRDVECGSLLPLSAEGACSLPVTTSGSMRASRGGNKQPPGKAGASSRTPEEPNTEHQAPSTAP